MNKKQKLLIELGLTAVFLASMPRAEAPTHSDALKSKCGDLFNWCNLMQDSQEAISPTKHDNYAPARDFVG